MRGKLSYIGAALVLLPLILTCALFPAAQQALTLLVNGRSFRATVIEMNGHRYVELEGLVRATNGSLVFRDNEINLTIPAYSDTASPAVSSAAAAGSSTLSRGFLQAGIEAMSSMREWHSALANAIQNQFPISANWLTNFQNEAQTDTHLAALAASTDADRRALEFMNTTYNNMKQLSDKYIAKRQALSYISHDSLQSDDLDRRIVACGHSLAAMVATSQLQEDGSCL